MAVVKYLSTYHMYFKNVISTQTDSSAKPEKR